MKEEAFTWRSPGAGLCIIVAIGLLTLSAGGGLLVLPYAKRNVGTAGIWDAICSAAGVPSARPSQAGPAVSVPSQVVVFAGMLANPPAESIGRGATLALQCAICHGPGGTSESQFPNLAGQHASVIYKELQDFKSGARANTVMAPFALRMSEQDIRDAAAYYASLPRQPGWHPGVIKVSPNIVAYGDPMRGIAPCRSCHGGMDFKVASPWLEGQAAAYIEAQLNGFSHSNRRNDIGGLMRNVARRMTDQEIRQVAEFYSSQRLLASHDTE